LSPEPDSWWFIRHSMSLLMHKIESKFNIWDRFEQSSSGGRASRS
jgi:hypothetical protein